MALCAQRRTHHVLRAFKTRFFVVVVGEKQVLRTRFGVRRQAAVARFGDHLERLGGRQVHDVNRHVGDFGERDGAMGRFGFGASRPRQRVILRRRLSLGQRLLRQHVDHAAVFGVHADRAAVLPGPQQRLEDARIVEHEHARIRHEQLERRHALADERVHLEFHLIVELGHDHVEAVVDRGFAVRLLHPRFPGVVQRLAAVLNGEVDDRGRSAVSRRDRARFEIVGRRRAAERHVEMRVHVDAAREEIFAGGVDDALDTAAASSDMPMAVTLSPSINTSPL